MIFSWILYILIYISGWIITSILIYRIAEYFVKIFYKSDIREKILYNRWWNIILRYFVIFLLPMFYFILSVFNYYPPNRIDEIFLESDNTAKIELISNEVNQIEKTLSNIENLTIAEIRKELNKTLLFTRELKEEAIYNQRLMTELLGKVEREKNRAQDAENFANEIEGLSDKQIEAIKHMITKDAYKQNTKSFWIGSILSFFTGILASYIASSIYSKFGNNNQKSH